MKKINVSILAVCLLIVSFTIIATEKGSSNVIAFVYAGEDQEVYEGEVVQFNGTAMYQVTYPVWPVDVSGNGQYLAIGWDKNVTFFSTASNIPIWTYNTGGEGRVGDVKLSDDGMFLVAGRYQSLFFFNTTSGTPLWSVTPGGPKIRYDGDPGNRLDMTKDGKYIAAAAEGDRVVVYDTTSSTPMVPYWDYTFGGEMSIVRFSRDGNYLSMGAKNGKLKLGWVPTRSINWTATPGDIVYSSSLSYDGSRISCGKGNSHRVHLYDSGSPTPLWTSTVMGRQLEQVMSDDGNYLASGNHWDGFSGTWSGFAFWNTSSSTPVWTYSTGTGAPSNADAIDMDIDANYVVGGSRTNNVYLFSQLSDNVSGWSSLDGNPIFTYDTGGIINYNGISIDYDGKYFAAGSYVGGVFLFSTEVTPHLEWTWFTDTLFPIIDPENYKWDFNNYVDSDLDGNFINDIDATGPAPTHIYGDNGIYTVTLRVTDDQGLSDTDTCNLTVLNVDPTVTIESAVMNVEISLRVAGSKWSNIGLTLYEDDNAIGYIEVERWPGNPDNNPYYENLALPTTLDMTKSYKAIVTYDPYPDNGDEIDGDQPNNGKDKFDNAGNPVWIIIKFRNGTEERIHHTFNTQQSKRRNSEHWNHVEPWEVDLNYYLIGHYFELTSHVIDPGSDDEILAYTYGSQKFIVTYLNNPPNPDPYPSPELNPRDITDTTLLLYEGSGNLILKVEDDDGGIGFASLEVA